jgi:hypothetical protein
LNAAAGKTMQAIVRVQEHGEDYAFVHNVDANHTVVVIQYCVNTAVHA